ncbi:MAG: PrsW family glutamic-type intramembrane protease [Anaerolineales bacterium]
MVSSPSSHRDWQTILTLGFSILGMLYFLIQSLVMGGLWLTTLFSEGMGSAQNISFGLLLWSSLMSGFLLLPLTLMSLSQLRGKPLPRWLDPKDSAVGKWLMGLLLVWPLIVFIGWWTSGKPVAASFLLGPVNLLAAGLPVLWIFNAARRKLNGDVPVRQWRIFGFSLTILPPVVIIVELLAVLLIALIMGILLVYNISLGSQIEEALTDLTNQIEVAGQDPEMIFQLIKPYLSQPTVIVWILVVFGGVVPIVEELLKPIALLGLVRHDVSIQEGFVSGILCGAGFALMENILYLSMAVTSQDWLLLTVGRAGTGAMHMLGSGLIGWGLAKTLRGGKWWFAVLTSLAAFLLHGLWNALALVVGIVPLFLVGLEPTFWQTILFNSPLILLFVLSIAGLFGINRHLRKKFEPEVGVSALNA